MLDERFETTRERQLSWNKFYSESDFGIGVECCKCKKWRLIYDFEESKVPENWECSMSIIDKRRGNCSIPTDLNENDFVSEKFLPGNIVWAKQDGYPWWPALIEDNPDIEEYVWRDSAGNQIYHVTFFGEKVSRAWVKEEKVCSFQERPKIRVNKKYKRQLAVAEAQARIAASLSLKDRFDRFSFAVLYKGKWPKAENFGYEVPLPKKLKKTKDTSIKIIKKRKVITPTQRHESNKRKETDEQQDSETSDDDYDIIESILKRHPNLRWKDLPTKDDIPTNDNLKDNLADDDSLISTKESNVILPEEKANSMPSCSDFVSNSNADDSHEFTTFQDQDILWEKTCILSPEKDHLTQLAIKSSINADGPNLDQSAHTSQNTGSVYKCLEVEDSSSSESSDDKASDNTSAVNDLQPFPPTEIGPSTEAERSDSNFTADALLPSTGNSSLDAESPRSSLSGEHVVPGNELCATTDESVFSPMKFILDEMTVDPCSIYRSYTYTKNS